MKKKTVSKLSRFNGYVKQPSESKYFNKLPKNEKKLLGGRFAL